MNSAHLEQDETKAVWHLLDEARSSRHAPQPPQPHILVVDDEPLQRASLKELLETSGYVCTAAASGGEALDALAANGFDLMLLDIHMPQMDGLQVLKAMERRHADTSVVIVSGDPSWTNARLAMKRGVEDFIRKPYLPHELLSTIHNSLEKRRLKALSAAMQEHLRLSEQLHRFLVNQSPDLIFVLDNDWRFRFVNEQFENLLGFSREKLIGQRFSSLMADDSPFPPLEPDGNGESSGATRNLELRLRTNPTSAAPQEAPAITVELSAERIFGPGDNGAPECLLGTYGVARDITQRKQAEELVNYQAYHDLLTGLPNRALFSDRLDQAIHHARRNGALLGVLFLDLDRFKLVNDTLGHSLGDRLLQEVAERVQKGIRQADTLARIGGDEFLLLLPQIRRPSHASMIAEKIQRALRAPFHLDTHELFVRASIGIALYPQDGETPDMLVKRADMAMYEVKSGGRDGHGFYSAVLDAKYAHKLDIEHGLRRALEKDELELHYQPLVRISDRSLLSMEALVRWNHPEKGLIGPDSFIREAEENGVIVDIGRWVMRRALTDLRHWIDSGKRPVPVSINVSAPQVEHPHCVAQVRALLEEFRIPGHLLQFELTENVLMKSMSTVIPKLQALGEMGIRIAIDDFGTGYSSLSYLKNLPIHTLKVDQMFLADIDARNVRETIVAAIATMARGLALELVAEGVEQEVQATYLLEIGCDYGQGYLFGRPIPHREATRLLKSPPGGNPNNSN